MAENWTFSGPSYRGATVPWLPDTNETWRRDMAAAPRSDANKILDLQQDLGWKLEDVKNRGQMENLQNQLDFINSFGPNERLNLYQEPDNPRNALLNKIVNQNVQGEDKVLQMGLKDYARRRKEYLENIKLSRDYQNQALNQAKFSADRSRTAQNNELSRARLAQTARQNAIANALRQKALAQGGSIAKQRLDAENARQSNQYYDNDFKQAAKLVSQGADPESIAETFQLDPEDVDRLQAYADMYDQGLSEDDQQAQDIADSLNEQQFAMLQKGMHDPADPRSFWDKITGVPAPTSSPVPRLDPKDLAKLEAGAFKMGRGAVRLGDAGLFEVAPRGRQSAPSFPERAPIPTGALTPAQAAQLRPGTKYIGTDGRTRIRGGAQYSVPAVQPRPIPSFRLTPADVNNVIPFGSGQQGYGGFAWPQF